MTRLIGQADVLVQNLAPGAAARMGLGAEQLMAKHPRLIVCDISGYGDDGPYRDKKAYDLLIQSEAGYLSVTGTADEPAKSGNSIADIAAGMYAYTNILAALMQRARTGKGSHIDVSMLEALAEWMGFPMYYAFDGATPPERNGASHATIFPYGPFPAGDGGSVMLGIQNEREWQSFCEVVLQSPAQACGRGLPARHEAGDSAAQRRVGGAADAGLYGLWAGKVGAERAAGAGVVVGTVTGEVGMPVRAPLVKLPSSPATSA